MSHYQYGGQTDWQNKYTNKSLYLSTFPEHLPLAEPRNLFWLVKFHRNNVSLLQRRTEKPRAPPPCRRGQGSRVSWLRQPPSDCVEQNQPPGHMKHFMGTQSDLCFCAKQRRRWSRLLPQHDTGSSDQDGHQTWLTRPSQSPFSPVSSRACTVTPVSWTAFLPSVHPVPAYFLAYAAGRVVLI